MGDLLAGMDIEQELMRAEMESVSDYASVAPSVGASNSNVQVVVRVRPPSGREKEQGYCKVVGVDPGAHSITLNVRPQSRTFTFDYVADEGVNQEEIFQSVGKPITDACLQGYHCCLIAYGQTGAGKTFTMEGPDSDIATSNLKMFGEQSNFFLHERHGLIPRILNYIFQSMMAEKTQANDVEYVMKCSYLQIYNEQVSDLLDPGSTNLTIHEDSKHGMYVEGLQEVVVSTPAATYAVFRRGSENRHVGMTAMNMESSRSHSVFTLVVESQRRNDGGVMNRRTSRFYLVDLAGSERQKHSESAGIRLKEAGSINKSLSALGNVIKALVDISEGKIRHVPYRDSKLTFLLKDALGGNSKCTLVANVSPAEKNVDETLSTLKFAQRAKLMLNTAVVNEDMFGNPAIMGEEIRRLRLEIAFLRASIGSAVAADQMALPPQEYQSESNRVNRLEHIISQSTKRSLASERKAASEISDLTLRLEATQAICDRLDKTLQSHKMIIRLRENRIQRLENGPLPEDEEILDLKEEIEHLRKQVEHHPDVVKFKMELDLCRAQLEDYQNGRKDEESLQSQIEQIENLSQAIKVELQEVIDDKSSLNQELAEVKGERDSAKAELQILEEQFLKLREAVEKYRQEAEEAVYRQSRAEEKLQDSTTEQNEVWRRCNLAEAQATELAQELASLKSQGDKMSSAFREQSKLQEEMFIELQNATQERDDCKKALSDFEKKVAQAAVSKLELENQLQELEVERTKVKAALQEMVTVSEQLAATVKEKDTSLLELKSEVDAAKAKLKATEDMLATVITEKEALETARLTALKEVADLGQTMQQLITDKKEAEALELEAENRWQQEKQQLHGLVAEFTMIVSEKELAILSRANDVAQQVDSSQKDVEVLVEELHTSVQSQVERVEQDVMQLSAELEAQIVQFVSSKEHAEAKLSDLTERNKVLHGEIQALQEVIRQLEQNEEGHLQKVNSLQQELNEVLQQQEITSQQLIVVSAEYESALKTYTEKHIVDIPVDRGATPMEEERRGMDSTVLHAANMVANNASKGTDMKFVADRDESTPLKYLDDKQKGDPDAGTLICLQPVEMAALECGSLPDTEVLNRELGFACMLRQDGENVVGFPAAEDVKRSQAVPSLATNIFKDTVSDNEVPAVHFQGKHGVEPVEWTLSVQGITPKLSLPAFEVNSQNIDARYVCKSGPRGNNCASTKRGDDQQRQLVLLDMNRQQSLDTDVQAVKREARTSVSIKEASLGEAGLTMGARLTDNYPTEEKSLDASGLRESRNELKNLSDLVKSAIEEIESQLRKHSEILKPSSGSAESASHMEEASVVASVTPSEDFRNNLAKYRETMSLWEYSRQKWEADLVFMKNEMTQIEGFRTAYEDLIPRLQELVSVGEELMSASQQKTGISHQPTSSMDSTKRNIEMDVSSPLVFGCNAGSVACVSGRVSTRIVDGQREPFVPKPVHKSTVKPLKVSRKVATSKFHKDSMGLISLAQEATAGGNVFRPASDRERSKSVQMPTNAPPQTTLSTFQTKLSIPRSMLRAASSGADLAARRPLNPLHGNTVANRPGSNGFAALRRKPRTDHNAQGLQHALPPLPSSPTCPHKRRKLG